MKKHIFNIIPIISIVLLCLVLKFAEISNGMIISIALIMIFLIIFNQAVKTPNHLKLKIFIILFSFFVLPLIVLYNLNVFSSLTLFGSMLMVIFVILFAVLTIYTMIEVNLVEIEFEGETL